MLIEVLSEFNKRKTLYISTHFNHLSEITDLAKDAVFIIREEGLGVVDKAKERLEDIHDVLKRPGFTGR